MESEAAIFLTQIVIVLFISSLIKLLFDDKLLFSANEVEISLISPDQEDPISQISFFKEIGFEGITCPTLV